METDHIFKSCARPRNTNLYRISIVYMLATVSFLSWAWADSTNIHIFMYKHNAPGTPLSTFYPSDEIVVQVNFLELEKGSYSFTVEWYNPKGELQETTHYDFSQAQTSPFAIISKLKLHPAGTLNRMLSGTEENGYDNQFIGIWKARVYLNDKELAKQTFKIIS